MLDNQKIIYTQLENAFQENTNVAIIGYAGCGKTTVVNKFLETQRNKGFELISFKCDNGLGLYHLKDALDKSSRAGVDIAFTFDVAIGHIFNIGVEATPKAKLNNEVAEILSKIRKKAKKKKVIVLVDHAEFLSGICQQIIIELISDKNKNLRFLLTTNFTNNADISSFIKEHKIKALTFPVLDVESFKQFLQIEPAIPQLTNSVENFLRIHVNNNLTQLKSIITNYNNGTIRFDSNSAIDFDSMIKTMLLSNIAKSNYPDKLNEALKFASLLDESFTTEQMASLPQFTAPIAKQVLEEAYNLLIVKKLEEPFEERWDFYLTLFKIIFQEDTKPQSLVFYNEITECLKRTNPTKYKRRAEFAQKANNNDAKDILLALELAQQMRIYAEFNHQLFKNIDNGEIKKFIEIYYKAWIEYVNQNYMNAIEYVEKISSMLPVELQAEKDLLYAMSSSKTLDENIRTLARDKLAYYKKVEDVNGEVDIWQRLCLRKSTTYVHCGQYAEARDCERDFIQTLGQNWNVGEQNIVGKFRYNIMQRKSNSLYSCQIAKEKMEEAVSFFKGENNSEEFPLFIKQYYVALSNYMGILIENGLFAATDARDDNYAQKINEKIVALKKHYVKQYFPREYIYANNVILLEYFSNLITAEKAAKKFEIFLDTFSLRADRLFYINNLSIFYAMSGDLDKAIEVLELESKLQIKEDLEGLYSFCSSVNLEIYRFLKNNSNRGQHIEKLKNIRFSEYPDKHLDKKKVESFIAVMESSSATSATDWDKEVNNYMADKLAKPLSNYYGKGFVFCTVYSWDED